MPLVIVVAIIFFYRLMWKLKYMGVVWDKFEWWNSKQCLILIVGWKLSSASHNQ